jgi:hypothetical protein
MYYFATLPLIVTKDPNGNPVAAVNLMNNASIITKLLNSPALYYEYDIQEGDTPETIAAKYYGDSYRYWLVLFANRLMDPQWDWPLTYSEFNEYITSKYAAVAAAANTTPLAYTQSTIHTYEKTITTVDLISQTSTSNTYYIDLPTYTNTIPVSETVNLQSGNQMSYTLTKQPLYIYDWENQLNEAKRSIKLINSAFVSQIEQEFDSLMST